MKLDWFTISAQVLNFLILVWLMKRFLYKPILHTIDEREKRIAAELANADQKKADAQRESDEFNHKNQEFDQQRAALMNKAIDESNVERLRLLDEARKAADALRTRRQEALRNEAHNLYETISRRAQQEIFAIARKALTDLAGTNLEELIGTLFIRRLQEMADQEKANMIATFKTAPDSAVVQSAFELPAKQRTAIQNAIAKTFSSKTHIRFETAPNLISGIEFSMNGQKVAWSISDYLGSLEKNINELLKEQEPTRSQR